MIKKLIERFKEALEKTDNKKATTKKAPVKKTTTTKKTSTKKKSSFSIKEECLRLSRNR